LKKNARYLKLWGKVIGSQKDYFIAEGQADGGEEAGELAPETEPKGTGVNKWNFYVCTELAGEWTELPLITPSQLRTARRIKYVFTGDLNRAVLTNPLFPGKESHLVPLT
jgi:radial spoke head protein 4/6